MSSAKAVRRVSAVTGLAFVAVVGLSATARPAAPAAAGPSAPAATKSIWDQTPYALYDQRGRVDPFTLGKPKGPSRPISPDAPDMPNDVIAKVLGKSMRAYEEAEELLVSDVEDRYGQCTGACQKGILELRQTIADIGKDEALVRFLEPARSLMDRFQRLDATSKRLKQRQVVEAEFAKLNIIVDGIVWNEQSPAAAVNGHVVGEGSVLPLGAGGKDVQVYRIRRDAVVFVYQNVQVSVRLNRGGL